MTVTDADGVPVTFRDGTELVGLLADFTGGAIFQHAGGEPGGFTFDEAEQRWVVVRAPYGEVVLVDLADGVFGAAAEAAVRELQATEGTAVACNAGPATWFETYGPDVRVPAAPMVVSGPQGDEVSALPVSDPTGVLSILMG